MHFWQRGGGVFNIDKNKDSKDNIEKYDEDDNNNNDGNIWEEVLRWVSVNGGDEAKCGTMPSWQGGKGDYNEDDDDLSRQ